MFSPAEIVTFLRSVLRLDEDDVYRVDGPLHLADLGPVASMTRDDLRDLRDEPFFWTDLGTGEGGSNPELEGEGLEHGAGAGLVLDP